MYVRTEEIKYKYMLVQVHVRTCVLTMYLRFITSTWLVQVHVSTCTDHALTFLSTQ